MAGLLKGRAVAVIKHPVLKAEVEVQLHALLNIVKVTR
jgi:hypothetical protein